ncbi:uncharacterized protein [Ptychodera flava]|uniref:uncharacterized protein n=1 Tax=Ptychodera flava TaxID=63121 RepID=UPI00396A4E6A
MATITHAQLQVQRKEENMTEQSSNTGLEVIEGSKLGDVEKKQTQPEPLVVKAKQDQLTKAVQLTEGDTTKATNTKTSHLTPCAIQDPSGKPIQSEVGKKDGDRTETITHTQLTEQRKLSEENMTKQSSNTGLEVIEGSELGDVEKKQTQLQPLVVTAKQDQPIKAVQLTEGDTTKSTKTKQSNLRPCAMKDSSGGWSKFTLEGQGPCPGQKFNNPHGLTFHNDRLLVCDKGNNIV